MVDLNQPGSIERTVALMEIHTILNRYAGMARDKVDFTKLAKACFRPDGFFRLPNGHAVKPIEMSAVVQDGEAKYIRHHITGINVHFESETEARTMAQFIAITDQAVPDHWGHWEDIFTRSEDGAWLIFDRKLVIDSQDPKGWFAAKYVPET